MTRPTSLLRFVAIALLTVLSVGSGLAFAQDMQPVRGGTLRVGIPGDLPTLDVHWSTTAAVWEVGWHIFETVLALDEQGIPIPNLATVTPEDGGRVLRMDLRRNVKFHNGKTMTADDVIASLERWLRLSTTARTAFGGKFDRFEKVDDYTVLMHLAEPSATALVALATPDRGSYIMPKEVVEAAGEGEVHEYIGTGPFKFDDWQHDRYIRFVRFEDYEPVPGGPNGYGGTKTAWIDTLIFVPMPDVMTRVNALSAGELDAGDVPADLFDVLAMDPNLNVYTAKSGVTVAMVFNMRQGVMANDLLRKAVLRAIDPSPVMRAAFGSERFYELHPSFMPSGSYWWSQAGDELYRTRDLEEARRLVEASGYDGEPIRWITTREREYLYNSALVASSQMAEAGLNVELTVVDWATLTDIRTRSQDWDIYSTWFTVKVDPTMIAFLTTNFPGWYETEGKVRLMNMLALETDQSVRRQYWEELQALIYEEVAAITFGEVLATRVARGNVHGIWTGATSPFFWNVWIGR